MKTKTAVVIVTFNGSRWLKPLIESILKSSIAVEIIAVDNASTDNSIEILETFSSLQIIKCEQNLGFGKANNIGIKLALQQNVDFIFLLNQDTIVFENTIQNLVNSMIENKNFGIISPMHFAPNESDLDANFENYFNKKINNYDTNLVEVPFVNAAAWLVSKNCFEKTGLFEPVFNHYGEDRNYCSRTTFHNFKIGIAQNSKIIHDRVISRSFKKDVLQSQYKILNEFININNSIFVSIFNGFKNVFGLPKFFFKNYGFFKSAQLFLSLSIYFFGILIKYLKINAIRNVSKQGKNGF